MTINIKRRPGLKPSKTNKNNDKIKNWFNKAKELAKQYENLIITADLDEFVNFINYHLPEEEQLAHVTINHALYNTKPTTQEAEDFNIEVRKWFEVEKLKSEMDVVHYLNRPTNNLWQRESFVLKARFRTKWADYSKVDHNINAKVEVKSKLASIFEDVDSQDQGE